MLALPTRRQHLPTIPSPPCSQHLYQQHSPQTFAAQPTFDQKILIDYLESQQYPFATSTSPPNSYMSGAYSTDFANPAIRIQQSTPTPQLPQGFTQPSMLSASNAGSGLESWNSYGNVQSQPLQTLPQRQNRGHQRASSSSSIGSSASQYQPVGHAAGYQYVAHSENWPLRPDDANRHSRSLQNHLPTPTQTPTQESFMNANHFNNYSHNSVNMDHTMSAHMSMKQALMEHTGEDVPEFAHSAGQSVSSYGHDSPATPHTAQDDMDMKMPVNGKILSSRTDAWLFDEFCTYNEPEMRPVPKFERTYTDIAADTGFYEPSTSSTSVPQSKPAQPSLLSPYRSNTNENVQRALQAAQFARSQSPSSTASRSDSPFRRGSPYRQPSNSFTSPMSTAMAMREQNRQADAAYAMKSHMSATEDAEPKTISPKDALLDYRDTDEDSKAPLFPDNGANEYGNQYTGGEQYKNATQSNFDTPSSHSYRRDSWNTPQFSPNFSTSTSSSLQPSSNFNFATPSLQSNMQGLSMNAPAQYRQSANNMSSVVDQTPEFPAHMTSMESSASEAEPPNGSQNSVLSDRYMSKPASTGAESGTYSCTYHGCSQRFETPQKLQKHKREGHRSANLSTAMTSAAILERNSQAGPHKCERINPTTGKPCNTVFSRPYDLTRHEDTIHNARKQKVRCALCVEEKTFSRNDALTRHMRVVHPEVDFPGKHRRRGGNHD
ncbi:hypothetical protein COCMIDRAFT_25193 [Bipolaris oryzae ATCC 44560]|uniref:C2H2-type domain-containing protein n=1 Tax=Bipolaris oryzae ATCC 44560 TaxID=930090 RepID=W6ZT19_COCMI|nr:uncharacterized protein COCMIDRAFT_25193 [Bipolaris oryzae ATCC 44560]EUC46851.1 hypothetical protein COCMIDRAFT_25193 [Bipolaris oryzae ATCC 44560]